MGTDAIKALKDRYGKKLIHQRVYFAPARSPNATASGTPPLRGCLGANSYKDAKKMLQEFERWLRDINESAADSLLEASRRC